MAVAFRLGGIWENGAVALGILLGVLQVPVYLWLSRGSATQGWRQRVWSLASIHCLSVLVAWAL